MEKIWALSKNSIFLGKNIKLLTILFLLIINNSFSQQTTGKVVYNVKLTLTIKKINERVKNMKKQYRNNELIFSLKKMVLNSSEETSTLLFFNNESNYKLVKRLDNEASEKKNVLKENAGGDKLYYTNIVKQKSIVEDCSLLDKCYSIISDKPQWTLTQETKKIGKYVCYKAILENSKNRIQKPIAWYTNEIPLGFGPKNYYGLPGLILELEDAISIFKATIVEVNRSEKTSIKKPKGKEVSEKEFKQLLKESFPDFYNHKK